MSTLSTYAQRKSNTNEATIAPNLVDINVTNSLPALSESTTLRQMFPENIISDIEIQAAIEYRDAFKQGDVITALCQFFNNAKAAYFKQEDFSLENILYWYQKLTYSNKEITSYSSATEYYGQNILSNQFPGASLFATNSYNGSSYDQNNYIDNVSDSIGLLTNSKHLQLDSTLPIFDIGQDYYGVPVPYSPSIENKLSASARNVAYDLSRKTTTLMRHNLLGVAYTNLTLQQNLAADATVPHGLNLINDLPIFTQFNSYIEAFKDALASTFAEAKLFSFIQYLSNIGNETAMNLRDIFPVQPSDKDFTVVTSEESAQASQAIADQEIADATYRQEIYNQQQGFNSIDQARYNNYTSSTLYDPTAQTGDENTLKYNPSTQSPITADMIEGTGNVTERNVSTYGSYKSDLTTFLDIKPPRPADGVEYWKSRGVDIAAAEARMYSKYPGWRPTLSVQDTTRGAYVGSNLTANFDVAVSKSYGYPPGTLLRITQNGKPVGAEVGNKDGIFRVGDTGGGSLKQRNALDFYTGNDPQVAKYYDNLDKRSAGLRVEVVKLKT